MAKKTSNLPRRQALRCVMPACEPAAICERLLQGGVGGNSPYECGARGSWRLQGSGDSNLFFSSNGKKKKIKIKNDDAVEIVDRLSRGLLVPHFLIVIVIFSILRIAWNWDGSGEQRETNPLWQSGGESAVHPYAFRKKWIGVWEIAQLLPLRRSCLVLLWFVFECELPLSDSCRLVSLLYRWTKVCFFLDLWGYCLLLIIEWKRKCVPQAPHKRALSVDHFALRLHESSFHPHAGANRREWEKARFNGTLSWAMEPSPLGVNLPTCFIKFKSAF